MARLRLLGLAIGFAGLLGVTAGPASGASSRHPLFNDQGTLVWYTSLDDAQAVARASGKLIFIESGRRACGNCRHVVEQVLPASNVRSRIAAIAIGLAEDCDESDSRVSNLLTAGVPDATVLPLCGFVTPELRWVTGFSGYMDPASFSGHLSRAEDRYEQLTRYRKSKLPLAPAPVCPTPAPEYAKPTPRPIPVPPPPAPRALPPPASPVAPARPTTPMLPAPRPIAPAPGPVAGPVMPTPAPTAQPVAPPPPKPVIGMAGAPMERARHAAAEGRWGDVLKVNDESPRLSVAEKAEFDALLRRANNWVLGSFDSAMSSARARRYPDAKRTLAVLSTQLTGTTCPGLIDAERGMRAIDRLSAIEQGTPEQADAPEQLRKVAYADFRGSRWASLFRGRSTSSK